MKIVLDFVIINFSALFVYFLREIYGRFPKEPPSYYMPRYLLVLFGLNVLYLFLFWFLGAYDKRHKRALLEEFILIFGVISIGLFVLITYLFLGQMWWMSRGILYSFWIVSIILICFERRLVNISSVSPVVTIDMGNIKEELMKKSCECKNSPINSLSVIIVSTNEIDKLKQCLHSIKTSGLEDKLEIIVVNNNSTDGTLEFLREKYPKIKVVINKVKCGYPRSVNNGIREATTDYYLVLNPDIIILPGSIEIALNYAVEHPSVGMVGCKLLNEDGTLQFSVRTFLDLRTYLYRFTPLRGLMAGSEIERSYLMQDWDHNDNRLVDWVLGGCMLIKKSTLDDVGLMDENIFLYFDDVDLCFRLWEKGWQVAYVSDSVMIHKHMRTSANKIFNRATIEHIKSLFYFIWKYGFKIPPNCPSSM